MGKENTEWYPYHTEDLVKARIAKQQEEKQAKQKKAEQKKEER